MNYLPDLDLCLGKTPADDLIPANPVDNQRQCIRADADRLESAKITELNSLWRDLKSPTCLPEFYGACTTMLKPLLVHHDRGYCRRVPRSQR